MPHSALKLIPGVDQNKTLALNEAAISETSLVRFIPDRSGLGLVQKLGGWTKFYASQIGSTVRALWAWEDINSRSWLGVGATQSLSAIENGGLKTITPEITVADDVPVSFTTTAGSSTVIIDDVGSNLDAFDVVDIKTQVSIDGLVLFGLYRVTPISVDQYSIEARDALGNPAYAILGTTGGAVPEFTFTTGSPSVKVTLDNHGLLVGDTFPILVPTTAGTVTLSGNYIVTSLDGTFPTDAFNIQASSSATEANVTGASGTGTTATLTLPTNYTIPVGSTIDVSGMNPAGYDGTYTVTASSAGSVSFASAETGTFVSGGTIFVASAFENGGKASFVYYNGIGPLAANSGYGVGGYGGSSSFTTATTSGTGAIATVTFANFNVVPVGNPVTIQGVTPSGYNGTFTVTASSAGSVSFASTATGAQTVAGSLYYGGGYGSGIPPSSGGGTAITNIVDWSLDNWGETLIASPLDGPIYEWSPSANNPVATIIPEAPQVNEGCFVAMPQRQIIAYGSTFNGVKDPLLIRWCDVANYNSWIGLVTNQAGSYRIPKGSKIIQGIQGPQQALLWTDLAIWAMQYVGPPYVYQFNELGTGCGLIGRKAAASVNGIVYWMGQSQFFKLSAGGVEPIRCPVWDVIFQDLDTTNLDKIRVAPNSRFGEISWFYPTNSNGGEVSHYVKYNFILDQWDFGELARTAWINESVLGPPIGADPNQYIYQHETSPDADGQAMISSFQTGFFVLTEANVKMFIDQIWPDMKWGYYGGTQNAQVQLTFFVSDYAGQTPLQYGPYTMTQATTYITPRFRGRLVSIKMESNDVGSFWRIGNMRYRYQEDGRF